MDQKLLNLIPKRFRCPYCGEWHPWDRIYELGCYDSKRQCAQFECANGTPGYDNGDYRIYFSDGYCYYSTSPICGKARQVITGKIPIDSIIIIPIRNNKNNPMKILTYNFSCNKYLLTANFSIFSPVLNLSELYLKQANILSFLKNMEISIIQRNI